MSVHIGTRLGAYEIVSNLGAGGMGEVYRARDTRLDRDVALKILPENFSGDVDRLGRFEREAKVLAALNHPNIAHVYDSGTSAGTSYLVMELVAGDDLSALIERGPVPVDEALRIAGQIVDALVTAHDAGIVHRDLKPANIKVRHDGTVKVLDFGLAKAIQPARSSGAHRDDSATITAPANTAHGVILGTPAYMSPEQARGESVDRRGDIWAFGAVLYEMLSGRRAFDGATAADVVGAVVHLDPDWMALPSNLPAAIRALLQGCLQKDRAKRVSDISTARFVIGAASSLVDERPSMPRTVRRWSPALVALTTLVALLGGALWWTLVRRAPSAVARVTVTPPEDQRLAGLGGVEIALSPDGASMVYVGQTPGGGTRLLRRSLDDLNAVPLPGTEGASAPVVSPDGRAIAFLADGAIRTMPIEGGPAFTVVNAGATPSWGDDGLIYFGRGNLVYRVPASGGEPVAVTSPEPNIVQQWVDALPGGRGVLLTLVIGTPAQAQIAVVGPRGGAPKRILAGTMARFAAGHIVYATATGSLLKAPFDVQRLEVTGASVPLVEGVALDNSAATQFAVSRSGDLLYTTGTGLASELVWVSRDGAATPIDSRWTGEFASPALSPDGSQVAVALQGQESRDIWTMQFDRGSRLRLTLDGNRNDMPSWTPDGEAVTFSSDRVSPSFDLWTKRSNGSGDPVLELDEEWALAETAWSQDGTWFVHRTSINVRGAGDILGRRKDRGEKPVPIVASRFTEMAPALSPNGRWMAYTSNETGRSEVVVVPFPNAGDAKWPVSVGGGVEPLWSRDGHELFYRNSKRELVSVRVETGGAFSIGATSVLFADHDYLRLGFHRQYDVTPDGQRFLMVRPIGAGRERRLILVRNAFSASASGAVR